MRPTKEFWYDTPHQVHCGGFMNRGIVFHEYFIDAATGSLWLIKDLLRAARLVGISEDDLIVEYDDWADFSQNI